MATPVRIIGKNNEQATVVDGGLAVSQIPAPASTNDILTLPYVNFFTVGGDGTTDDLRVDGSVTPVDAYVEAEAGADIYINTISIVVSANAGAGGIYLEDFGAIQGGLTNGIVPYFADKGERLAFAERPLFSNFDLVRIGTLTPALGQDQLSFRLQASRNSNDYAYVANWDMTRLSPYGLGLRMSANTKQQVGVTIQDDLTGLVGFEILATGYRRFVE